MTLELTGDAGGYEAAARGIEVLVAAACLAVHVEAVRDDKG
jgi:hypothetical protein